MLYAIKIRLNADDEGRLWGGVWQREDHAERSCTVFFRLEDAEYFCDLNNNVLRGRTRKRAAEWPKWSPVVLDRMEQSEQVERLVKLDAEIKEQDNG